MAVNYLFTRYRFNWDEVDFSIFATYSMVTNLIGTSISVGVFSHLMKIDDAIVGIYSSVSKILSSFVYGFAKTSLVFYLGKVNSLFGACEALMPLIYGPMYSATYAATLNIMPGLFYILGGILTIPAVIIFGWMYIQHRKDAKVNDAKDKQDIENAAQQSSILKDVILMASPAKPQIGSPIMNGYRKEVGKQGVTNPAFEGDK
ncbi:hypothetical protein WA026_010027 [Henosepilachna vigintioctopunctata]|uniref:Uncharacterized protein n=1 Tax=Henosepilachna vigintioctopunctata TaxID=420089 RepID=A0AAW1UK85_9CUCU